MELATLIKNNNLKLRTQAEIVDKFSKILQEPEMFDFRPEVLIDYLSFEDAKAHLKEDFVNDVESGAKQWEQVSSVEKCAEEFLNYMKFAWGKAEDQRGLSASRSIQKLSIWLWLMGKDDLVELIEDDGLYNPYGAPALIKVCDKLGIEVPDSLREFSKHKC